METILAIDPGTTDSAFVLWDGDQIIQKGIIPNKSMHQFITKEHCDFVAVEMVASYGMAVGKDVFETVVWIGKYLRDAEIQRLPNAKIYRKDVKMFQCQSMRAKDSNIRQALIDKFGKPGTKKEPNPVYNDSTVKVSKDIWSALAIADYAKNTFGQKRLVIK